MLRYLEFIRDGDRLICVVQPEELFVPGTLVETNFHEEQTSMIKGTLKSTYEEDIFAICYFVGESSEEELIRSAGLSRDFVGEAERQRWLKEGLVSQEQIAGDYVPQVVERRLVFRKGKGHSNKWFSKQRSSAECLRRRLAATSGGHGNGEV